jgi:hypothetical protein
MLDEQGMLALESHIREVLEARRKEIKMTETELGAKAFPFVADSRRKIQGIRNKTGAGGKPQRLKIGEVMNLCEALGLEWAKVVWKAEDAVRGTTAE